MKSPTWLLVVLGASVGSGAAGACTGGEASTATSDAGPSIGDASGTDASTADVRPDAACSTVRGTPEHGVLPILSGDYASVAAQDDRLFYAASRGSPWGECTSSGGAMLSRVRAQSSAAGPAGPGSADLDILCFGGGGPSSFHDVHLVAYSRAANLIGAVGPNNSTDHDITVAILPANDPAWAKALTFSTAQRFTRYPHLGLADAGDAGLISGERVTAATASAFLGSNLLVVGQTGEVGLTVLFSDNGQSNPNALAATALVEPRVSLFQAVAPISTGGAWVAGPTSTGRVGIVRLTQGNSLDNAFGTSGFVEVGENGQGRRVHGMGVDALGRLIIVSTVTTTAADAASTAFPMVLRLSPGGQVDLTFGTAGVAHVPLVTAGPRAQFSVIVEPNGGTLVGGLVPPPAGQAFSLRAAVGRLDGDGNADSTFGGSGLATAPLLPGKSAGDGLSPDGVAIALTPQSDSCRSKFFAFFSQEGAAGYVFE
jgi:hypothetical protein